MTEPRNVYLVRGEERVPMLPVYIGETFDRHIGGMARTWELWVHPDWPHDLVLDLRRGAPTLTMDALPARSLVRLQARNVGFELTVLRHPG